MKAGALLHGLVARDSRAFVAAVLLLLVALFLPAFKLPRDVYTYMVFIDITQSMNVEDHEQDGVPVSRLAFARNAVHRAIQDLPCGSRVGLGAFADYRTLALIAPIEVCGNYNDLLIALDYIDGNMRWKNASEIAKGVFWSVRAARDIGGHPAIVFLTDGQESPPLRPGVHPSAEDIKPGQIRGWLIGVGGDTPRPIPKTDRAGNAVGYWRADDVVQRVGESGEKLAGSSEHLSALREPYLKELATQVGFEYARLTTPSSVSKAMRDPTFSHSEPVDTDLSWIPAAMALLVLVLRFLPDYAAWRRMRKTRPIVESAA